VIVSVDEGLDFVALLTDRTVCRSIVPTAFLTIILEEPQDGVLTEAWGVIEELARHKSHGGCGEGHSCCRGKLHGEEEA
jgi:hypothetical protein